MSNYFYDMLPKEEFERIPYLPTMGEFVNWFAKEYADMPAVLLYSLIVFVLSVLFLGGLLYLFESSTRGFVHRIFRALKSR